MNDLSLLIAAILVIGFAAVGVVYSITLQRKALARAANAFGSVSESLARQKEALALQREAAELMRENNQLLKEILKAIDSR